MTDQQLAQYDAIVIGAGVAGIYQIYRPQEMGFNATVLETAEGPGDTCYWNRYSGSRFDSESYTYGYSFSQELLEEWDWSEHVAGQAETLRYLNHVVDKFDLRRHMQFGCKVPGASFDEDGDFWRIRLWDGRELTSRFALTAIGMLSAATMPRIEGVDDFEGDSWHTYYWAHEPVVMADKRVAVIGTGATGIQVNSEIADKIRSRVYDPVTAKRLTPQDHGFGTRRVPLETRYYEGF